MDGYRLEDVDYDPFAGAPPPGVDPAAPPPGYKLEDVDYDPFAAAPGKNPYMREPGGSFFLEVPKGVAGGATTAIGTAMTGLGGIRQEDMYRRKQEAARAEVIPDQFPGTVTPITPELRQKLTTATESIEAPDITQDPWYQAGEAVKGWSEEQFAAAKNYEDTWTRKIAEGLGSTIPFMAASVAGGGVGGALVVGGALGSAMSSGEAIERAVQGGASKEQILEALVLGQLPGLTEQASVELLLGKIPLPAVGRVVGVLGKILAKAAAEGGQEAVQQTLQNVIANFVYDPSQSYSEGVLEAAVIGAAVGGIVGAPTSLGGKRGEADEETVGEAGDVQPEGVTDPAADIGESTPGKVDATAPAKPVPGAPAAVTTDEAKEKIPADAALVTVEPAAAAAPAPVLKAPDAIVTEVKPGEVPGDINAAIAAAAPPAPVEEAGPNLEGDPEEFAEEEYVDTEAETPAIPEAAPPLVPPVQETSEPALVAPEPVLVAPPAADVSLVPPVQEPVPSVEVPVAGAPQVGKTPEQIRLEGEADLARLLAPARPTMPEPAPSAGARIATQAPVEKIPAPGVPIKGPTERLAPAALAETPAAKAAPSLATRSVVDRILQDVRAAGDPELEGDMRTRAIVERVANRLVSQFQPGLAGRRLQDAIDAVAPAALAEVKDTLVQERVAEATRGEASEALSKRLAEERLAGKGTGQEKRRSTKEGPTAEVVSQERSKTWWTNLVTRERAKPEAEQDPHIVELGAIRARRVRTKEPVKAGELDARADVLKAIIDQKIRARSEAAKPRRGRKKKEAPPPPPEPTVEETPEAKGKREKAEAEAAETQRVEDIRKALEPVVDATKADINERTTSKQLAQMKKTFIGDFIERGSAAVKATKRTLAEQLRSGEKSANSPEENVLIWAKRLGSKKEDFPGQHVTQLWQALKYLQGYRAGNKQDLNNLVGMITEGRIESRRTNVETSDVIGKNIKDGDYDTDVAGPLLDAEWSALGEDMSPLPAGLTLHGEPTTGTQPVLVLTSKGLVQVTALKTTNAKSALKAANAVADSVRGRTNRALRGTRGTGFYHVMRKLVSRQLSHLVGDVDVVFVSHEDSQNLSVSGLGFQGVYYNYPAEERMAGAVPRIFINADIYNQLGAIKQAELIIHEVTHAATSYALSSNLRGTQQIVDAMRKGLRTDMAIRGMHGELAKFQNAFKNEREFIAEAFSNIEFQRLLATLKVPTTVAARMNALATDSVPNPSWFDAFVRMVANAIMPGRGGLARLTYFEHVVSLAPQFMMSSSEQEEHAAGFADESPMARGAEDARHPMDFMPISADIKERLEGAGHRGADLFDWSKKILVKRTTGHLKRAADNVFGPGAELFRRYADQLLKSGPLRIKYREAGDRVVGGMVEAFRKFNKDFAAATDIVYDATLSQVDLDDTLGKGNNKHIKKGVTHAQQTAAYNRLKPKWDALPGPVKTALRTAIGHYRKMADLESTKSVDNIIRSVMRPVKDGGLGIALPAGETPATFAQWVMDGDIDRKTAKDPQNVGPNERTQRDEDMHKAIGRSNVIKSLQGASHLRRIKGWYVPLTRHGKWFFTARETIPTPTGAVRDASVTDQTQFTFRGEKDLRAYLAKEERPATTIVEWVHPVTGAKMKKMDIQAAKVAGGLLVPVKQFRVTVQDKVMEMQDSKSRLEKIRQDYDGKNNFKASDVALVEKDYANSDLTPSHVRTMLSSVEQYMPKGSASTNAVKGSIVSAYVRTLNGNRSAHMKLKRKRVRGFSRDLLTATATSNAAIAGRLASLDLAQDTADIERELSDFINDERNQGKGGTPARQRMFGEIQSRMNKVRSRGEDTSGKRVGDSALQLSYIMYLMTPAFSIFGALQPLVTTAPVLNSKFGSGAGSKEIGKALRDIGAGKLYFSGLAETARETVNAFRAIPQAQKDHDSWVRARISRTEPGFLKVMDRLAELGWGASAGVEAPAAGEINKTFAEKFISRTAKVARAVPEAIEAVNRYVTALAAYRLAKRSGMSEGEAVEYATSTVEQTQFGYAPENNPAIMSNPWARIPLQFKQYPLAYAQLYYTALAGTIGPNDFQARKEAGKQLAWMSAMTVVFAGVGGLPMMEIAKGFMLMASLFGLDDNDWEDWENAMQQFFANRWKWLGGSKSNSEMFGEMMQHGFTRALNIDTSSRMSNSSALLFGEPESQDEADWKAWLFDLAVGAPGGALTDKIKAFREGDYSKAMPLPKMLTDTINAYEKHTEGFKTAAGRQYAPKLTRTEAVLSAIGVRPASVSRQYEGQGGGAKHAREQKIIAQRSKVMGQWTNASPARRQQVWRKEIQEWNRSNPKHRIDMSSLRRSLGTRERNERRERMESR